MNRAGIEHWYRIELPYAVFAIVVMNGKVIDAAPVAGWALGRQADEVLSYYKKRGATVQAIGV